MRILGLGIAAIAINNKIHGYQGVERVKIIANKIEDLLRVKRSGLEDLGYLVLETCSRFEIYLSGYEESIKDLSQDLRAGVAELASIDPKIYSGGELLTHMLKVLSGGESPAPFEIDIVNQARASIAKAFSQRSLDKHLQKIFKEAIEISISIRRSLGISGSIGIPEVAVSAAKEILGPLPGKRITVFGTGEVARRIAGALKNEGVRSASIVGRTYSRAQALAGIFPDGRIYTAIDASRALDKSDLVFLATSSREPIVRARDVDRSGGALFIDLSNPRNVDLDAREQLGDRYIWLDSLENISKKILRDLYEKLRDLDNEIQRHVARLETMLILENIKLELSSYARLLESIRRGEVERAVSILKLDQGQREVLEIVTTSIVNKALGALGEFLEDQILRRSFTNG